MEAVLSVRLLRARRPSALGAAWVRQVRPVFGPVNVPLHVLSLVERLVDLPRMALQAPSIPDALQQMEVGRLGSLPSRTDLAVVWDGGAAESMQSWLRDLRRGDRRARGELVRLFLDYNRRAVAPYWRSIRSYLAAERSRLGRVMAEGGVDLLLATLHPKVRWRFPVLEVTGEVETSPPGSGEPLLHEPGDPRLAGVLEVRSLVVVPSTFCLDGPRLLCSPDPTLPAVLVYPALRLIDEADALWMPGHASSPSALARLLGRTQAAVLSAIAEPCTTSDLAARVGRSPATASHHTGILRGAGLVTSHRHGNSVTHRLTPLGADLLGAPA